MKKKYNDKSDKFSDWSNKKLKQEYINYDHLIYDIECFGVKDMIILDGIGRELDRRGIEIKSQIYFN